MPDRPLNQGGEIDKASMAREASIAWHQAALCWGYQMLTPPLPLEAQQPCHAANSPRPRDEGVPTWRVPPAQAEEQKEAKKRAQLARADKAREVTRTAPHAPAVPRAARLRSASRSARRLAAGR